MTVLVVIVVTVATVVAVAGLVVTDDHFTSSLMKAVRTVVVIDDSTW